MSQVALSRILLRAPGRSEPALDMLTCDLRTTNLPMSHQSLLMYSEWPTNHVTPRWTAKVRDGFPRQLPPVSHNNSRRPWCLYSWALCWLSCQPGPWNFSGLRSRCPCTRVVSRVPDFSRVGCELVSDSETLHYLLKLITLHLVLLIKKKMDIQKTWSINSVLDEVSWSLAYPQIPLLGSTYAWLILW